MCDLKVTHAAISCGVFQVNGLDFGEWVMVACGQCSPVLQEKSAAVAVEGVDERIHRQWIW